LLDTGDVTLQFPGRHTVHCLIDVPMCKESDYEILAAPATTDGLYSRAFRFDDAAKQGLQRLAARTGAMNPTDAFRCSTCTGEDGDLGRGFRAQVYGTVTATATADGVPPTISLLDATASHQLAAGTACSAMDFPTQNPDFGPTTTTTTGTTPVAVPVVAVAPATSPVAAAASPAVATATSAADKKERNNVIVKVLALIAFAGVAVLSLFGNQMFGAVRAATATAAAAGTPNNKDPDSHNNINNNNVDYSQVKKVELEEEAAV
jgi:hypothetical protein